MGGSQVAPTDTTLRGGAPHVSAAVKKAAVKRKLIVVQDDADSLNGLGGYHGSVHVSGTDTVYYAVGVYSQTEADGTVNGIPVFDQPWKNVVATFDHELNEARTDADVEDAIRAGNNLNANSFLGWVSDQGEECGDFPVSEAGGNLTEVFQEVELTDNSRSRAVHVFGCGARTRRADCPSESTSQFSSAKRGIFLAC